MAQRTDPEHPGVSVVTNYVSGRSVEEAVAKAREVLEKPGGVYGDQGLHRVVEVVEEGPSSELRQQEGARRRYLTTILEAAKATVRGRELDNQDADLLSLLDDFFTRAVVFPDPHTGGVRPRPHQATFGWTSEPPGITHASDPGRALAVFLLACLDHYGLAVASPGTADVRRSERADLVRLERFVRETVLPGTHPHTMERRRVLEALGEAGGLCTARTVDSDGDVVVCTREAGHYDPDDVPPFRGGEPGGWHKAGASIWKDSGTASTPHTAV